MVAGFHTLSFLWPIKIVHCTLCLHRYATGCTPHASLSDTVQLFLDLCFIFSSSYWYIFLLQSFFFSFRFVCHWIEIEWMRLWLSKWICYFGNVIAIQFSGTIVAMKHTILCHGKLLPIDSIDCQWLLTMKPFISPDFGEYSLRYC